MPSIHRMHVLCSNCMQATCRFHPCDSGCSAPLQNGCSRAVSGYPSATGYQVSAAQGSQFRLRSTAQTPGCCLLCCSLLCCRGTSRRIQAQAHPGVPSTAAQWLEGETIWCTATWVMQLRYAAGLKWRCNRRTVLRLLKTVTVNHFAQNPALNTWQGLKGLVGSVASSG